MEVLKDEGIEVNLDKKIYDKEDKLPCDCPASKVMGFSEDKTTEKKEVSIRSSQLHQWSVQLTLVPPLAPYFIEKDVILVADCIGYSVGDFYKDYLKDGSIAIACPKLDTNHDIYLDKLTHMIRDAKINTLTVMMMEVPCCTGLLTLAKKAAENDSRKIPIKLVVIGIK